VWSKKLNKDSLNMQVRKFLKKVGVTSQRTIEDAVNQAVESSRLKAGDKIDATMTLEIGELDISMKIEETIQID
jgi:hypothetical protein